MTIFISGSILKLSDLDSVTIFIFGWRGGGGGAYSELQNRGNSVEFGPKIQPLQQAHASQIVSHILRMWRLISESAMLWYVQNWSYYRPQGKVMFSHTSVILFTIGLMDTRCKWTLAPSPVYISPLPNMAIIPVNDRKSRQNPVPWPYMVRRQMNRWGFFYMVHRSLLILVGYSVIPCYGAVGTHSTGMLSFCELISKSPCSWLGCQIYDQCFHTLRKWSCCIPKRLKYKR